MQYTSKFGIYVNSKNGEVVRINSTLVQIRDLAKEKGLSDDPDTLVWGRIPLKEEDRS